MSPREFSMACQAQREEDKRQHERDLSHAWAVAAFAAQAMLNKEGLKPLNHYLGRKAAAPTVEEQKAKLRMMAEAFGGKVRPADKSIRVIRKKAT